MTEQQDVCMNSSDQGTWSGKTSHHSAPTVEKTSRQSSQKLSGSLDKTHPMFLYLTGGGGADLDASWVSETMDTRFPLLGEYMTLSFGESPREESVSHLSQILEDSVLPKYCLSAKAAQGILRRAETRNREMPEILCESLENAIHDKIH